MPNIESYRIKVKTKIQLQEPTTNRPLGEFEIEKLITTPLTAIVRDCFEDLYLYQRFEGEPPGVIWRDAGLDYEEVLDRFEAWVYALSPEELQRYAKNMLTKEFIKLYLMRYGIARIDEMNMRQDYYPIPKMHITEIAIITGTTQELQQETTE